MIIGDLLTVPRGSVPDYRTFVRQCWTVGPVGAPPIMYSFTVDPKNPDSYILLTIAHLIRMQEARGSYRLRLEPLNDKTAIVFIDLAILHRFLLLLASEAKNSKSLATKQILEFFLLTLGFKWG